MPPQRPSRHPAPNRALSATGAPPAASLPATSRRAILPLLIPGILLPALSGTGCRRSGEFAPPFTATTQYGRRVRNEDFRGQTLLLTLWATWCPHCRSQLAAMQQVAADFRSSQIAMLALSVDREGWEVVRPYLAETGLSIPVGLADLATQRAYGAAGGIPITWVISRSGILLTDIPGALDATALREVIAEYAA